MKIAKSFAILGSIAAVVSATITASAQDIRVYQASGDRPGQILYYGAASNVIYGTDFGPLSVSSGARSNFFYIKNLDHDTVLSIGAVVVGGAHPGDFSVTQPSQGNLAPGQSTAFQVTFNPTVAGVRTATITVSSNDSDLDNPFIINVTGTGLNGFPFSSPELSVSPRKTKAKYNKKTYMTDIKGELQILNASASPAGIATVEIYASRDEFLDNTDSLIATVPTKEITGQIYWDKPMKVKYKVSTDLTMGILYYRIKPGGGHVDYERGNGLNDMPFGVTLSW